MFIYIYKKTEKVNKKQKSKEQSGIKTHVPKSLPSAKFTTREPCVNFTMFWFLSWVMEWGVESGEWTEGITERG